ncbi:hypothetical protein [Lunatimonas salinarum]|uniref:hypothetical protein n=1 Tax=Lunatimonas salinarum TaxID=1774590 RepID=UPI001ADFA0C4|nr:hypothetical protein [Lunatimonas salinarum]
MKNILSTMGLFLLIALTSVTFGQKREIERAVPLSEVPERAKIWLSKTYQGQRKVKWYFQTDGEKQVYEAKLKWNGSWHSVEFQPNGNIQNIEILIRTRDLEEDVRKRLFAYLNSEYSGFKIDRMQIHYTGSDKALGNLISEGKVGPELNLEYEIEYIGRVNGVSSLWEGQFDSVGNLIEKRSVELSSTDVLDF